MTPPPGLVSQCHGDTVRDRPTVVTAPRHTDMEAGRENTRDTNHRKKIIPDVNESPSRPQLQVCVTGSIGDREAWREVTLLHTGETFVPRMMQCDHIHSKSGMGWRGAR